MKSTTRTALITGASRGLGLVVAQRLAADGLRCILLARDGDALDAAVGSLKASGADACAMRLDLEQAGDPRELANAVRAVTDRLDVLVLNAALGGIRVPLPDYPHDLWRQLFQVNVHAVHALLSATHPMLRESPAGRVVFVSTGVARRWKATTGAYGASKAAMEAIAGIYAVETADTSIRVNTINPGPTRTAMRASAFPDEDPSVLKTPEDIVPLFVDLSSPDCAIHGETINADVWLERGRDVQRAIRD
ncbi:SDR family NAD(P)-dependent oxidoreductase [soil metagenome]